MRNIWCWAVRQRGLGIGGVFFGRGMEGSWPPCGAQGGHPSHGPAGVLSFPTRCGADNAGRSPGVGRPPTVAPHFLTALHRSLAEAVAERLRRREQVLAERVFAGAVSGGRELSPMQEALGSLPPERRLSVADVRELERQRARAAIASSSGPAVGSQGQRPPPASGEARQRGLRQRLVELIRADMEVCPARLGSPALEFLELFERVTGEPFSDTPGALVGSRVRGMDKVLGNVAVEERWVPPLEKVNLRGWLRWTRRPREPVDAEAWRRRVEAAEAHTGPVRRIRQQMADADLGLAAWLADHPFLVPVQEVESGESGVALLLLWEVDHQQAFPSQGGEGLSGP